MEQAFPPAEALDSDVQTARLTAVNALLAPERRESRRDVLVSSMVSILTARPNLTRPRLYAAVRNMWRASALPNSLLDQAVFDGRASNLISQVTSLDEQELFQATSMALLESEQDLKHVEHLLSEFTDELESRLHEYEDSERLLGKSQRITGLCIAAIAGASVGYGMETPGASPWIRPIRIARSALDDFVSDLEPKSIREPVRQLAFDALDPTDDFGNDLVHIVMVGALLHGLATQQGFDSKADLTDTRVLLDTSSLMGLATDENDRENRRVVELVRMTVASGASVYVADHTLAEWERVWAAADAEERGVRKRAEPGLPPRMQRVVGNPFLAGFMQYRYNGGDQSWPRWQRDRRNLRAKLGQLGVRIVALGELSAEDQKCFEAIQERLSELSDDPTVQGSRRIMAVDADARSATLVARWRRDKRVAAAVFLAKDSLTGRAFSEVSDGNERLVGDPYAWLLYVSNLQRDEHTSPLTVVELVADATVRETVLAMAGTYTLEEALDMSEILCNERGTQPSSREMRDLVDATLFDALDELQIEVAEDPKARASAVLQRRASRSLRRAQQREDLQDAELSRVRESADELVAHEQRRADASDALSSTLEKRAETAEIALAGKNSVLETTSNENIVLRRSIKAIFAVAIPLIITIIVFSWGLVGLRGGLIACLTVALGAFLAYLWANSPEKPTSHLVAVTAAQVVAEILVVLVL